MHWESLRKSTTLPNVSRSNAYPLYRFSLVFTGAKRISLLFAETTLDFKLDPQRTLDIPDITVGDEVFSDGCGLMAKNLATQVAKRRKIKFRNKWYTPTVMQIRCFVSCYTLPSRL